MNFKKTSSFFTLSGARPERSRRVKGLKAINWQRFTLLFVLIGWGFSYISQLHYDTWRHYGAPKLTNVDFNVYIEPQPISPELAKLTSFGANEFLADYYWLTFIQYYGGGTANGKYRKMAELFNVVTELSPKFLSAYQTGLIILPGEGFVDEAIKLGQKGQVELPNSWEMPYYTGLVYHIYKKDYISAAQEFEKAAVKTDAPAITKYFAGIYYREADQRQLAYQIFQTVYQTTTDEFVKERANKQVINMEMIFFLEDAASKYKNTYGIFPETLDDLVRRKIVTELPISPLSLEFNINPETGVVENVLKK